MKAGSRQGEALNTKNGDRVIEKKSTKMLKILLRLSLMQILPSKEVTGIVHSIYHSPENSKYAHVIKINTCDQISTQI